MLRQILRGVEAEAPRRDFVLLCGVEVGLACILAGVGVVDDDALAGREVLPRRLDALV